MSVGRAVDHTVHHALVHERHGVESSRLRQLAITQQRFAAFGKHQLRAADDPGVEVASAGVDVAQREDAEHRVVGGHGVGFANGGGVRGEILVAEHDAARAAGGAGGVENCGERAGVWGLQTGDSGLAMVAAARARADISCASCVDAQSRSA